MEAPKLSPEALTILEPIHEELINFQLKLKKLKPHLSGAINHSLTVKLRKRIISTLGSAQKSVQYLVAHVTGRPIQQKKKDRTAEAIEDVLNTTFTKPSKKEEAEARASRLRLQAEKLEEKSKSEAVNFEDLDLDSDYEEEEESDD